MVVLSKAHSGFGLHDPVPKHYIEIVDVNSTHMMLLDEVDLARSGCKCCFPVVDGSHRFVKVFVLLFLVAAGGNHHQGDDHPDASMWCLFHISTGLKLAQN